MSWETFVAKLGIDTLKGAFGAIRGNVSKSRHRQLLSAAVAELLQLDPDINAAEASIRAAEALGQPSSRELLNARDLLAKVKWHTKKAKKKMAKGAARKKVAEKKATKKKAPRKKTAKKKGAKRKG